MKIICAKNYVLHTNRKSNKQAIELILIFFYSKTLPVVERRRIKRSLIKVLNEKNINWVQYSLKTTQYIDKKMC